jgi:hypothetical protein
MNPLMTSTFSCDTFRGVCRYLRVTCSEFGATGDRSDPGGAATLEANRLPGASRGTGASMELSLLLIVIGIVLAILVNYAIGIACILIGLVLLIWPRISASRGTRI